MLEDKTSKFVKTDEASIMLDSLIKNENDINSNVFPSSVFDPSSLTECSRRMIYRSNGDSHKNSKQYLSILNEHFTKKKWFGYLKKCKSIKVLDENVITADCHYNISGIIDIIIKMGDSKYAVKIKPIREEEFSQVKTKGAIKKHVVEVIVYLWLTELKDGFLLYENQNTNDYIIFHIKPYEPILKSVMKKCLDLIENKLQGIIPSRPYKTKESNECMFCEFSNKCWK